MKTVFSSKNKPVPGSPGKLKRCLPLNPPAKKSSFTPMDRA
jgi:hypothetical protein